MATKKSAPPDIDPRSDRIVLHFTGPRAVAGVPARDLHGGDLNRIVYTRAHRAIEWERRDEDGNAPDRPRAIATKAQLGALFTELLETGSYRKTAPKDEPAAPAEVPTIAPAPDHVDELSDQADDQATTDEPAAPAEG